MSKSTKHLSRHAKKHNEDHLHLKDLLSKYNPTKEKVGGIFVVTFLVVLLSLLIFRSWGGIVEALKPDPKLPPQQVETHGAKTGALSVYKVEKQASRDYRNLLSSILTVGSVQAADANAAFGQGRGEEMPKLGESLGNSVWTTNYLSSGQHLTKIMQKRAKGLQKSVLSTYYLGEKTIDINSTRQSDSKILSQIKNTLSVDLFQYLNQAVHRADALDEYLNLLKVLAEKSDERIADLQYKIDFLSANSQGREQEIRISESAFFENLQIFDGPNAEEDLAAFIGLRESQAEIRAKLGAYKSLQDYYQFFRPRLQNMTATIQVNRAPLIAGVKVVEIQNMTLPLIIRQR